MRNHQQNKENNINKNNNTSTNNNNNNSNNSNPTNLYQFCLHPVMSATVTAQHSGGATPTIMNNHTSTSTATTTNATSININTNTNTNSVHNNNNTALSPSATTANTNDTLNSQQKQIITTAATKISATLFNATKTNLSTSSSASSSSNSSSSLSPTTATLLSPSVALSGATIAASSPTVAVSLTTPSPKASPTLSSSSITITSALPAMPQTVAQQQLTKLGNANKNNDDDSHHHHNRHHHHEPIINNNNQTKCLNDATKSINSTTKSFKEIHHNNLNNNNNNNTNNSNHNNNNNHSNCNNNHFTELMQRNTNKGLSPTQESSNMSFSSASVAGSIQDDIGDQCGLTKAGLEEYTMRSNSFYDNPVLYHHQKQSSYAQSEGYHSYVSSSDSTSATPMLDRLRQESELLSRHTSSHHWSQNDLSSVASTSVATSPTLLLSSSRDLSELGGCTQQQQQQMQQHNNSSESTSSTETLKWLGSMSDVSEVSHATGFSAISESVSTSKLIVHSSRVLTPKRHQSETVLYRTEEQDQQQQPQKHPCIATSHSPQHSPNSLPEQASPPSLSNTLTHNHRHSPSYPPIHQNSLTLYRHQHNHHTASQDLTKSMTEKTSSQTTLSNCDASAQKSNISVTISNSEAVVTISPHPPPVPAPKPNLNLNGCNDMHKTSNNLAESKSQTNISTRSHGLPRQSSSLGMVAHKSVSASMDSLSDIKYPYRNNHRLFPVSTYTEPVHSNTSYFVHHPKPQYSTGLQKPKKPQQSTTLTASSSSTSSSSASSPSMSGSHSNLHQVKLGSPTYPQPSWQSVAALINDFEKTNDQQQPQKYTYLDPNKTHRVPNPALKAFQKNAVQSYFERQQQQQQQHNQNHAHSLDNLSPKSYQQQQPTILRPSSLQNPPPERVPTVLLRNSLPNNYSTTSGQRPLSEDKNAYSPRTLNSISNKPPSPAPPPPPPRSRSIMPTLLRRSSSASDYAELRDQFMSSPKEKLQSQSIKNISNSEKFSFNDCGMPPPPPPPRGRSSMPPRRTSSAAEYAAIRDKVLLQQAAALTHQQLHPQKHQHMGIMSSSYHQTTPHAHLPYQQHSPQTYPTALPMLPSPLHDGWVPERPPKNPNLRVPSPDLPPPPPGLETETIIPDEPLPPPPPEILQRQPIMNSTVELMAKPTSPNRRNSFAGASLRKTNYFNRSPSNDSVNVSGKGPPPLIPRKPANIELLQVTRPSAAILNQLNSTKLQPEFCRATIISSSTRKRPHNLAATSSVSSIPAIQENISMISVHNVRHSPTGSTMPLSKQISKSSPPPPPLMPRMPNLKQQQHQPQPSLLTQQQLSNSGSNINSHTSIQKSRCNSKASYLPRQSLEKQTSSDPDHGSYKMTLHSNEDLVTTTKTSYDILAQTPKLPNNLPDVLPLGAKLQPSSNTSLNSNPSLRYGSNNNISSNSPTSPQTYSTYVQQQQHAQQQQRYSTPVLNTFNLSSNFTRSQSFDTNVHNAINQSSTKYMTQSSVDLKKPLNNLETTIEEPHLLDATTLKDNHSSLSSLSSLSESCNSHEDRLNASLNASNMSSATSNETIQSNSIFRAELVNTTFANNASNNNKKSVTRQESLRENIEKITQLQSQLMSAHITDNVFMVGGYGSQLLNQSNTNKSSQANVIDVPKSQEPMKIDEGNPCSATTAESLPTAPSTPPPVEEDLMIKGAATNANTYSLKSPKILEKEHIADRSIMSQLDSSTDSLKLVQRSELILRVNANTVETASQTDDITDSELKNLSEIINTKETETPTRITLQPRQRLPIEDDCDKLSKELADMLTPNDALIHILCPAGPKTVADYVTNLYNPNVPLRPTKRDVGTSTLTRSSKNKEEEQESNEKITVELKLTELEHTPENCDILKNKVDDLIKNLNNKVRILTKEQSCIGEESAINDELGDCLLNKLNNKIRPIEASKCRTYISDIGHITGLLLSLSERLARAENNLTTVDENNSEKKSLENKRDRLMEQLTEAKRLKEDIDRRGISVVNLLGKNLSLDEFADFEYFINMKAKLITDGRDIADKIKIGEEIITALSDTLIQSDC